MLYRSIADASGAPTEFAPANLNAQTIASNVVIDCDHPQACALAALWETKRGSGGMPTRADFDIEDLKPWFNHVLMVDVLDGGADFRYRMIGTHITDFMRRDRSGKKVTECSYDNSVSAVLATFRLPFETGRPVFKAGKVMWSVDRSWRQFTAVHCPLVDQHGRPAMTLGAVYFE